MNNLCTEDQETIREFLVESHENLSRLDLDLVELEKHPADTALLSGIFRTIHTIKGACGFLSFSTLEGIAHRSESLLGQLRDGKRKLTPALVSLILETVDATRKVLASIERDGNEGSLTFEDLTLRLGVAAELKPELDQPVARCLCEAPVSRSEPKGSENSPTLQECRQPVKASSVGDLQVPKEKTDGPDRKKQVPWDGVERRKLSAPEVEDAEPSSAAADANIRVAVDLMDKLMGLVEELGLVRNQVNQSSATREDPALNATSQRLNLITTELQQSVMKMRMQPIGAIWNKLPRMVRDLAIVLGKGVQLIMEGAETELDRTIIEAIKDPLMHLVRNSCDHGIQSPQIRMAAGKTAQGFLTLRAYHEGGQVIIEVADDGAGIDVARVKQKAVESGLLRAEQAEMLSDREVFSLIFEPGFSTAKTVTNISGRGVGMDVVKSHVEKIGGVVEVFSRLGEGTTIKIRIPLETKAAFPAVEQDGSPASRFPREVLVPD